MNPAVGPVSSTSQIRERALSNVGTNQAINYLGK